ncbi:MAG: RsmD family RNA methyltransferase [Planctomycetota bacterium]
MPRPRRRGPGRDAPPGELRLIAGEHRGRKLKVPPGQVARPMRNAVREALFNVLGPIEGLAALDLFAGSGSLGFEALSRGARAVTFVERAAPCLAVLAENLELLQAGDRGKVARHDLSRGLPREPRDPIELVFMHPPFPLLRERPGPHEANVEALIAEVAQDPRFAGGRLAFETPRELAYPDPRLHAWGFSAVWRRDYGTTCLLVCDIPSNA